MSRWVNFWKHYPYQYVNLWLNILPMGEGGRSRVLLWHENMALFEGETFRNSYPFQNIFTMGRTQFPYKITCYLGPYTCNDMQKSRYCPHYHYISFFLLSPLSPPEHDTSYYLFLTAKIFCPTFLIWISKWAKFVYHYNFGWTFSFLLFLQYILRYFVQRYLSPPPVTFCLPPFPTRVWRNMWMTSRKELHNSKLRIEIKNKIKKPIYHKRHLLICRDNHAPTMLVGRGEITRDKTGYDTRKRIHLCSIFLKSQLKSSACGIR